MREHDDIWNEKAVLYFNRTISKACYLIRSGLMMSLEVLIPSISFL